MVKKTYVCVQPCFLGGKRYEEGDTLPAGIQPNQHFRDLETGERVPAPKVEVKSTDGTIDEKSRAALAALEADKALVFELQEQVKNLLQELEKVKAGVAGELDELRESVILLNDRFDLLEGVANQKGETPSSDETPTNGDTVVKSKQSK